MFDFKRDVSGVGGWLTEDEGTYLYEASKKLLSGDLVVEVGSWKGRSTICIGKGLKEGEGSSVYSVDPHTGSSEHIRRFGHVDTYSEFLSNIKAAGIDTFVLPLKMTSLEASKTFNKPVSLILIDGAHEYSFVKGDYKLWSPKVKKGGTIAFHDSWHQPGVQIFTAGLLLTANNLRKPRLLDTLTIVEKVEKNTLKERWLNVMFVAYRLVVGWRGTLKIDREGTVF